MSTSASEGASLETITANLAVELITAVPEDLPDKYTDALHRIQVGSGSQSSFLVRRVTEKRRVRYRLVAVSGGLRQFGPGKEYPVDTFAVWEPALQLLKQIYVADTRQAQDSAAIDFLRDGGYRSVLIMPVVCRGYNIGFLGVATVDHTQNWDTSVHKGMQAAAEVLGNVLDRADVDSALAELRRSRRTAQRKALEAQEKEWRFLARELHDEIGPYLTAIKTAATIVAAKSSAPEVAGHVGSIKDQADHIYKSVHGLIRRLRSTVLDELGLEGALRNCVAESPLQMMPVDCQVTIAGELDDVDDTVASSLLRVLQECLNNVARHAEASRVEVSCVRERAVISDRRGRYRQGEQRALRLPLHEDSLTLRVRDNGVGMDRKKTRPGMGLRGMRERVEALSGHLDVISAPGEGTEINAVIVLSVSKSPV